MYHDLGTSLVGKQTNDLPAHSREIVLVSVYERLVPLQSLACRFDLPELRVMVGFSSSGIYSIEYCLE